MMHSEVFLMAARNYSYSTCATGILNKIAFKIDWQIKIAFFAINGFGFPLPIILLVKITYLEKR